MHSFATKKIPFGKKFVITEYPTNEDVKEFSKRNRMDLKKLVFDGGEEFELVFTTSPKNLTKIRKVGRESNIKIFPKQRKVKK